MNQQRDHCEFHLATTDLFPEVFGGSADHLTSHKNANDQKEQQVDHANAFSAVNTVQPHADHRRERRDGIQAIVFTIDRSVGDVHGQR